MIISLCAVYLYKTSLNKLKFFLSSLTFPSNTALIMLQSIPRNHQEASGALVTSKKKKPLPQIPNRSHQDQNHQSSTSIVPGPSWTTTAGLVDSSQVMYHDLIQDHTPQSAINYQYYQPAQYSYYYDNNYYNQPPYQCNGIDSNQEWKTSFKGLEPTVNRSDSLKIESTAVPKPFLKNSKLPLEPHFEKPHEQTAEPQQVSDNNTFLHRKISKEQVYSVNAAAPTSLLLQKLNEFSNRTANLDNSKDAFFSSFQDTQHQSPYAASATSGSSSSISSSNSDNSESNTPDSLSASSYQPPSTFARASTTYSSLKPETVRLQRHSTSMPLLIAQNKSGKQRQTGREEGKGEEEEEGEDASYSFSAAERYFDQPASASTISTARIPSPWGTSSSKCAFSVVSDGFNKDAVSRISTGSVPNLAIYTAQVPDEISLESSIANECPETNTGKPKQQLQTSSNLVVPAAFGDSNIQELFQSPASGKYSFSIASCSLVTIRSNIKLYRRMAIKTGNRETQLSYAKYLLQISKLYDKQSTSRITPVSMASNDANLTTSSKKCLQETPAQTRHRLLSEAGYWIERLAKAGNPEALFIQGRWYLLGPQAEDCVLKDYERVQEAKAFRCFVRASKSGWTEAHYELAHLWKKRGNFTKAIQCYEKGALEQHTLSIYKMAKILLRGQLKRKKDLIRGMEYLKQAADMNDSACAEPAFVLGCIYANEFERIGIQRYVDEATKTPNAQETANNSLALEYLKKSAHHGYPDAIYFMGQVSEKGMLGQLHDAWQAYQHYMRAAEVDHAGAMLDLSRIYCQGISGLLAIQKDIAFKWCRRSADLGFDQAEYVLGKYYEDGIGVAPDFPRALEYFGRAAAKGYPLAAEKLNRPMADGHQRRPSTCAGRRFIPPVTLQPKVKQDDDDDDDENDGYNDARLKANTGTGNNICTIQ
ncbi:hypothetical protein BD408DRAFT_417227 [Parasitella parasitica]|nr:hypothetical protein BD408DRAFT_417227 [Parasitella parasitica]